MFKFDSDTEKPKDVEKPKKPSYMDMLLADVGK
jgi:hypothetical protein